MAASASFAQRKGRPVFTILVSAAMAAACSPTVKIVAPDKPIVINLNVKIEQEVRIKLEKGVEDAVKSNPNIF